MSESKGQMKDKGGAGEPSDHPDVPVTTQPYHSSQQQYPPGQPQYTPSQPQYPPGQPQYPPGQPQYPPGQSQYPPGQPQYSPGQQQYPPMQPQPQAGFMQSSNTTVVVNQQPTIAAGPREWNDGLCGCFNDCGSCFYAICCPATMLCDLSSRMGEGCCFPCCCPGALLGLRIKLRVENNIQGSLMDDYCAVECCPLCVMCQLSRELKHLGR